MFLALLALASSAFAEPHASIVGGHVADEGEWPDAVGIVFNGYVGCTGVLVAPDVVLTAGHCAGGIRGVLLGTNDLESGGYVIDAADVIEYPDSWDTYDVAVVILEEPAVEAPRVIATDCIRDSDLVDGASVAIVGYGATDSWGSEFTRYLMEAETTIGDADCSDLERDCRPAVSPGGELIAGGDGTDSCNGDSGGPIYLVTAKGTYLAGTTSRASQPADVNCGDGGIYVRADAILEWVEAETGRTLPRPDCGGDYNQAPAPTGGAITLHSGETGTTGVNANDPDSGDVHFFSVVGAPTGGVASIDESGLVTYTADEDFVGQDSVHVVVTDDGDPALSGAVDIVVNVLENEPDDTGDTDTDTDPDTDTQDPDTDDGDGGVRLKKGGCSCDAVPPVSGLLVLGFLPWLLRRRR